MTRTRRHPGPVPGSSIVPGQAPRRRSEGPVPARTPERVRGDVEGKSHASRRVTALTLALALAACGKAAGLAPAQGHQLPVAPRGATATPTPTDLLAPTQQQRPQRGDELLRSSQERRDDEYDLPPE